ncbi:MAG: hypothetical protein IPM07_25600, partial [Anaerolineales bacterium]|nr:hypothetical protein [Anaerolineales bacterium]
KITADRAPGNEITGNYFLLSSFDNIGGYSNIVYQRPGDRGMLYTSGTLAPSAEADFVQWGRNSISNYRCAFKAELTIYRDDEYVRMCDIWVNHSPDVGYPVAHFVVVDKLANIADISVVVDAYRVSSSPNHEIRGRIKNNNDTENIFWEARVWLSASS